MPIPESSDGDSVPLVTTPMSFAAHNNVALARDARAVKYERNQHLLGAGRVRRADRFGADEIRIERARPCQSGFDRVAIARKIVAIQVEADLQAQRVARGKPGRLCSGDQQLFPYSGRVIRRKQQLHPVFAGVAGSTNQCLVSANRTFRCGHARWQRVGGQLGQDRACLGTLHRDHRVFICAVDDVHVEVAGVLREPLEIDLVVRRVGHRQIALRRQAVSEEIIDHSPVRQAEQGVLSSANGDLRHVVADEVLQELSRLRAGRFNLPHVRDVEDSGVQPNVLVLRADPLRILHRHLPAGEVDDLGSSGDVLRVKAGATKTP